MARSSVLEQNSGAFNKNMHKIIKIEDTATDRNLTADDSGALVILRATGGATDIQLPPAVPVNSDGDVLGSNEGVYYEFMINEATDGAITIEAKDGTDFFVGSVGDIETATPSNVAFNGSSHDELVIASGAAIGHVYLKIVCDGDNWCVSGYAHDVSDVSANTSSGNTRLV
jgi:hypothetical protein